MVQPDPYTAGAARYTLAAVFGAAAVLALLPESAFGEIAASQPQPVSPSGYADRIIIDGNRAGLSVAFDHKKHVEREGGDTSCARCHHLSDWGGRATSCARCHRDMYRSTSIFDHGLHVARLGSGQGCLSCHVDNTVAKDAEHTKPCLDCHTHMLPSNAVIRPKNPPHLGLAVGYLPALHGLCIKCHEQRAADPRVNKPALGQCATCHTGKVPAFDPVKPEARMNL